MVSLWRPDTDWLNEKATAFACWTAIAEASGVEPVPGPDALDSWSFGCYGGLLGWRTPEEVAAARNRF